MTTFYIDKKGLNASLEGEAIVVREKGQRIGTVPLGPIDRVVLRGEVTVDTRLLSRCGERGVGILILSGRKQLPTLLLPRGYKDAQRRLIQYEKSKDPNFCMRISKKILMEKLTSETTFLEGYFSKNLQLKPFLEASSQKIQENFDRLTGANNKCALMGIEGESARIYFQALSLMVPKDFGFNGRNKRPPRDPFNAVLSLGYTILASECTFTCMEHGLDPYISFLHELDFGRESLSCDLVEPFRTEIDKFSLNLFLEKKLTVHNFSTTEQGCFMNKEGRIIFYPAFEKLRGGLRKRISNYLLEIIHEMESASQGA
ncbi:CRISPR-associated endonuclease Cas1 [Turicimonas muris]|uniref:CRISPR-associated endonuclease Cas1 n=2 Tax=Turicimonas muris TaxID=1796652 RepID=UPI002573ACD5|nr:CRISPR-associated endonuclease Cas1 [Turicimonas muris]